MYPNAKEINMNIIGRSTEIQNLAQLTQNSKPIFLAVYGRRRVGKTYLINEFFKDKGLFFSLTGVKNAKIATQLKNFSLEYSECFLQGKPVEPPKDWMEAFHQLWKEIKTKKGKIIIFFDELPWLASKKSAFLEALDYFWNKFFSGKTNIIVIICGSSASWMIQKVISNKGGLHSRITHQIKLHPFSLLETKSFLEAQGIIYDLRQIVELYMAIGGIPKYLSYAQKGLSAAQNIQNMCFSREGFLISEFNKLYSSLFDHYEKHISIVRELAKVPYGLSYEELLKKTGLQSGGSTSHLLSELVESDFIGRISCFGKGVKDDVYQLMDEYSLFYLYWIHKAPLNSLKGVSSTYWIKNHQKQSFKSWSGFAFEKICLQHIDKILQALGISGVNTTESTWSYQPSHPSEKGCQIDLVINRDDSCINLCEIKFYNDAIALTKSQVDVFDEKLKIFREKTGTKKTLFKTLITTYGLKENAYSSSIDQVITLKELF